MPKQGPVPACVFELCTCVCVILICLSRRKQFLDKDPDNVMQYVAAKEKRRAEKAAASRAIKKQVHI